MKRLRKLFCLAVAMLWVLPVSAMEWNQHAQAEFDLLSGPSPLLASLTPLTDFIVADIDEFEHFDSSLYEVHYEMLNATWDPTTKALVIEAYNEAGDFLAVSNTIEYQVSVAFTPQVLTIVSGPNGTTIADNFVTNLPSNEPTARRIQIKPVLEIDSVQDCNQQVTMRSSARYDSALVGTDRPDHLVVPSSWLNSC